MGLIPAFISTFALLTSMLGTLWCYSIKFAPTNSNESTISLGAWSQQTYERSTIGNYYVIEQTCSPLPSGIEVDAKLRTVRAFSIITPILGGLLTVSLWFAPCFNRHSAKSWKTLATFYCVFLTLFQGLTFLIYPSIFCTDNTLVALLGGSYNQKCQWGQGSTANVISVVLWFCTGVSMIIVGVPVKEARPPPETQEVTYERTQNPDGTSTVAQVAVVKGTAVPTPPDEKAVEVETP